MGLVASTEAVRNVYTVIVVNPERKRPLGISRRRWEDEVKTDLNWRGCEGMNCFRVSQDTVQWRVLVKRFQRQGASLSAEQFAVSPLCCLPVLRNLHNDSSSAKQAVKRQIQGCDRK